MADVQTLYQLLLRNIHQDASSPNTRTTDSIMRAIAESLKYNRAQKTYFNEKNRLIELENDRSKYDLPQDFLGMRGEVFWLDSANAQTQVPLINAGVDFLLQLRPSDYEGLNDSTDPTTGLTVTDYYLQASDGLNYYYAIDQEGLSIYFGKRSGFVKFRYVADLGTIDYKHSGSAWVFYEPKTDTAITSTSTYSNRWFTDGFDALKTRAEYYLWSREFGNTEASANRAQIALAQWSDALTAIQSEGRSRNSNNQIRRWI